MRKSPVLNIRRMNLGLATCLTLFATTLAGARAPESQSTTVFAAASLKNVLDEVGATYTAKTHSKIRFSYGATSAIARQIEQGAPADMFISADSRWMDYLATRNLIIKSSRRDLLSNHLVLIAPASSRLHLQVRKAMSLAGALGSGRLAIAGPEVPAGAYGEASLRNLGVWDSVKSKLAPTENVRAALALVALGEAPLGIVYDTDAKVEPKVRVIGVFPDASHPAIVYPAALIAASHNSDAAKFLTYLHAPMAQAIFRKYGFVVLKP